jgi:cytochrome c553
MLRAHPHHFKSLLAMSLCVMMAAPALADDAAAIKEKAAVCATCHGEKGVPIDKLIPNIWGQKEGYLYLQLRDFKSGARKNDQMAAIVADLEKEDMAALAAYFTELPWPDLGQPSAPKDVAEKAIAANTSVACTGCHLAEWQGDSSVPRLAGQWREYLDQTTKAFRDRSRGNNPGMSDLMNAAVPEDLTAIAEYVAALRLNQ